MESLFNQKYKNQSFQTNYSRIYSNELTKEEIDENIRQCYNNLKNLKKTFKGRIFEKTYNDNIYNINKSSKNPNSVLNNLNLRPLSNEETEKYLIKNYSNKILKSSNSTSKIREMYKSKSIFDYNPYQNNVIKNPINSYGNYIYPIHKIQKKTSLIKTNNISNQELNKKHNNNDSYILFLQKQLNEQYNKNKNLNLNYQEIKIKYEKLTNDNKNLNEKLNLANKQINELEELKKKDSINEELKEKKNELNQKQIDILKNSLLDNQKLNNELINQSLTESKISDNELKSIVNNKNNELEIGSLKNQISSLNTIILNKDKTIKNLQETINKFKEENKVLNEKNTEFSNQIFSLNEELKNKEKIILNFKLTKTNQTESQDNSLLEINSHFESASKIYKRKTLSDYSVEKGKNNKSIKYIEEIKLKIPSPLKETVSREMPNRKYNNEQLFQEDIDGKIK